MLTLRHKTNFFSSSISITFFLQSFGRLTATFLLTFPRPLFFSYHSFFYVPCFMVHKAYINSKESLVVDLLITKIKKKLLFFLSATIFLCHFSIYWTQKRKKRTATDLSIDLVFSALNAFKWNIIVYVSDHWTLMPFIFRLLIYVARFGKST